MRDDTLTSMATKLAELKDKREGLEAQLKPVISEARELGEHFIKYCKENSIEGVKVNGRNVYFSTKMRTSILDEARAFEYFRSHNMGHLIREQIHSQTLSATVNQLIEADELDIPTAEAVGLSIYPQEVVNIRRT